MCIMMNELDTIIKSIVQNSNESDGRVLDYLKQLYSNMKKPTLDFDYKIIYYIV